MLSRLEIDSLKRRMKAQLGAFYQPLSEITGLSRTTLSFYFNHHPVSADSADRVLDGCIRLLRKSQKRQQSRVKGLEILTNANFSN